MYFFLFSFVVVVVSLNGTKSEGKVINFPDQLVPYSDSKENFYPSLSSHLTYRRDKKEQVFFKDSKLSMVFKRIIMKIQKV